MGRKLRGVAAFEAMLEKEEFRQDADEYRSSDEFSRITVVGWLIVKYGLPSRCTEVLRHFLETNEIDYSRMSEPVRVKRLDGEGVVLSLSHDITQPELKAFIEKRFVTDIRPILEEVSSDRRKRLTVEEVKRDSAIYSDYLNRNTLGLTIQGIALRHSVSKSTVERVIARMKALKKKG